MSQSKLRYHVATPYTKYHAGIWPAYKEAARITGNLLKRGYDVFSPIVHSHPLAFYGDIDPLDHKFWMAVDAPFMAGCDALIVVTMPGWNESDGVAAEIFEFKKRGKPIFYCDPATFDLSEHAPIKDVA